MPQLDITTYFTQVFYTVLVFLVFYVISLRFVLPGVLRIIKARKLKLFLLNLDIDFLLKEERLFLNKYNKSLGNSYSLLRKYISVSDSKSASEESFYSTFKARFN